MSLKERINEDMKSAMRARQAERLSAIRMLMAAIKQRKDSLTQFEQAGRQDLADRERAEIETLSVYLPQQADAAEIEAAIEETLAHVGAAGPQDMGKVMAVLKPKLAGRTDLSAVSAQVKARLNR